MKLDFDELAKNLGLPTWEKWSEHFDYGETWSYVFKEAKEEALRDGKDEDEAEAIAEEKAMEAEQEQELEEFNRYYDNLMHVAEKVFGEHGLSLVPADPPSPGYSMKDDLDGLRKKRR